MTLKFNQLNCCIKFSNNENANHPALMAERGARYGQSFLSPCSEPGEGNSRQTVVASWSKLFFIILLIVFGATSANASRTDIPLHSEPKELPDIVFYDEANNPVKLDRWRGKVVVLNIWATWCPPCVKEMPTLDRLQQKLGGDFFQVVVLSVDEAGVKAVKQFFKQTRVKNLDIHMDPGFKAAGALNALGLLTTLLIDVQGREMGRLVGDAEWDTPEMIGFFRKIIARQL